MSDPAAPSSKTLFAEALAHHQAGRLDAAEGLYRRLLDLAPRHADTLHLLGVLTHQRGEHEAGAALIRRAIALDGRRSAYHLNLGHTLRALGRLDEAVQALEAAVALAPDHAGARTSLGAALGEMGRLDEALEAQRQAVRLDPASAQVRYNLGNALRAKDQLDAALEAYGQAIHLQPGLAPAHGNLGLTLVELRRFSAAIAACQQALRHDPTQAEPHNTLGNALKALGRRDEAAACYERAIAASPGFAAAHVNLGVVRQEQGRLEDAVACWRRALELKPDDAEALSRLLHGLQHLCDWAETETLEQRLLTAVDAAAPGALPFALVATEASPARQLACARAFAAGLSAPAIAFGARPPRWDGKIRLGYLSADFHNHATAYLIAELIERHDRARFEVAAYSHGPDDDGPMRQRLVAGFDRFTDVRALSDREAAGRIHDDGIDILVDLKGYTRDSRTGILALRPAPVQVNYLGYPGSLGAGFIDYIVADRVCIPPGEEACYSEQVVRLAHSYQPNDSRRAIGETPSRAACGLPERGLVFCSFNNSYKITPAVFSVWMRLLTAAPGSVLWLLRTSTPAERHLNAQAAARGVDPARLVFAPRAPLPEHLARQRLADLFLDTRPCAAHTTASEALWAGLPLLTCPGPAFAGRVAASLLTALEVPELIAPDLAAYEALALGLAADPPALARLNAKIAAKIGTAPLFDTALYARGLDTALARIWARAEQGLPPQGFDLEG